jgi:hypothetical protein
MKISLLFTIYILFVISVFGQNSGYDVQVGEVFVIGKSVTPEYKYLNFPRANFIMKRGAIADFRNLKGRKVVVHEIVYPTENEPEVVLKLQDGRKFFRFYPTVTANFEKALDSGELRR